MARQSAAEEAHRVALAREERQRHAAYLAAYQNATAGTILISAVGTKTSETDSASLSISELATIYQQTLAANPDSISLVSALTDALNPLNQDFVVKVVTYDLSADDSPTNIMLATADHSAGVIPVSILFDGQAVAVVLFKMSPDQIRTLTRNYKPYILFTAAGDTQAPALFVAGLLFTNGRRLYASNTVRQNRSGVQLSLAAAQPYIAYQQQQQARARAMVKMAECQDLAQEYDEATNAILQARLLQIMARDCQ